MRTHLTLAILGALFASTGVADTVCNGIPAWDSSQVYNIAGVQAQYQKKLYKVLYWTQGTAPDKSGSWQFVDNCKYLPTQQDHVTVSVSSQVKGNIAFTDPQSNVSFILKPGQSSITLPYDAAKTYHITTNSGTITPGTFVANQNSDNLSLAYKPYNNQHELVGYLTASWGPQVTISQAAKMGYNTIAIAFGSISGTQIELIQDQIVAYTKWNPMTDSIRAKIREDILTAKEKYNLHHVILSVGGANGSVDLPSSNAEQKILAQNTIALLNKYGFDGIDFDKENASDDNGRRMDQYIKLLKSMTLNNGQTPIVTAAPQLNSVVAGDAGQVGIVSTASSEAYNIPIVNGDFDYLLLQAYNTGRSSNVINGADETQAQYISQAQRYFEAGYPGTIEAGGPLTTIKIPASTKIIIGEPATPGSAGNETIFHGSSADNPYQAMYQQYSLIMNDPQFGGIMTWDLNDDQQAGCPFSKTLAPLTSKSFVECPEAV